MSKAFVIDWKRSYWPEARPGSSRLTRAEAIRNCKEAIQRRKAERVAKAISSALTED